MIVGIGVDITEIDRVRAVLERHGERFLERIAGPAETGVDGYPGVVRFSPQRVAGLFAAKEAVLKALGTGWAEGLAPRQIVVRHDAKGRPEVRLEGAAAERARQLGATVVHVSISHERAHAVAFALLESREEAPSPQAGGKE